jgi:hypothetical protein
MANKISEQSSAAPLAGTEVIPCMSGSNKRSLTPANIASKYLAGGAAFSPTTLTASNWFKADSLSLSDNDPISSWSNSGAGTIDAVTATTTARPTYKTNIINSLPVVRYNGSSNFMQSTVGAAALTGSFYVGMLVKFSAVGSHQDLFSWGEATTGERRSVHLYNTSKMSFIGESADVATLSATLTTGTWYWVEMEYLASTNVAYCWVNGAYFMAGTLTGTLAAYAATTTRFGRNPGGTEYFAGDLAESVIVPSAVSAVNKARLRAYINSKYALSIASTIASPNIVPKFTSANVVGEANIGDGSALTIINNTTCIGTPSPAVSQGTGATPNNQALLTVGGALIADASQNNAEHLFVNAWGGQNVMGICSLNNTGLSAIRFLNSSKIERFAVGLGNSASSSPFADCGFIETSDDGSTSATPVPIKVVQSGNMLGSNGRHVQLEFDATGNIALGEAALATNATAGHVFIPSCAGTPTGTPTTKTGRLPVIIDSTNNKLYFYSGGSWRDAGP